ncbi:Ioc3p [Saccharomyces eubayanus]|uniref:Ioc3p n=1 Tax=Saccharomyces eubayanus TaxID=1080349 RepID=UPI0006C69861|nr:IOC3-like protein [Saccharomyces eubayanus]KOG99830.1 IOC3-like protein [Saccharomyces eubayanus]
MDSQPDSIQNSQQEAQGDSSTPVADLNHDRIPLDTSSQTDLNATTSQSLDNLRRSRRVPKPRSSIYDEYEEELKERANKPKRKRPAASKKKPSATQKDKPSGKVEKKKATTADKDGKPTLKANDKKVMPRPKPAHEQVEPALIPSNWTSAIPLLTSDFKNQYSVISRLKNPNMKPVPYAGDIIKLMAFINKFSSFFDHDLQNLSFQDFEVGLDLYPGDPKGNAAGIVRSPDDTSLLLYPDFMAIKDIVHCQDKMNFLFLTLLDLTFAENLDSKNAKKKGPLTTWDKLNSSSKKVFSSSLYRLRLVAHEWGYPREWRQHLPSDQDISKPRTALFEQDEQTPVVDPRRPEILTPNIYTWNKNEPLPLESDPLQNREMDKNGILALKPIDRIIMLRALADWCASHSPAAHNEIYKLTHGKKDPVFGIQTQQVPRYSIEGIDNTLNNFKRLCSLIQSRYEIRSKKKHFVKQLKEGKKPDLSRKLEVLKEIKTEMKNTAKPEKDEVLFSLYDKWAQLFEGELPDQPLGNPFAERLYKLRLQEFFLGRIPHIGDFYIPRLHSYGESLEMSTFTDLRSLQELLSKFKNNEYNAFTLFENDGQSMSAQFKLFYHDTPSLAHDVAQGKNTLGKVYWYEMCHDSATLLEFLEFLDCKIAKPKDEKKEEKDGEKESAVVTEAPPVEQKPNSTADSNPSLNTNPLPKDAKYNSARKKLQILKEFLGDFYFILRELEQMKVQFADMKPGKRQLRRIQRQNVNYNTEYDSEEYVDDEDDEQIEEDDEQIEEDDDDDDDDDNDDYDENDSFSSNGKTKRQRT